MTTTPTYTRWFAPAGDVSIPATPAARSASSFQAGDVIDSGSGNRNQSPPTQALQDFVPVTIEVPFAMDEEGNPRAILARIEATFSVEDWGYVTVDGKRIISMTSNEESHGIHGGHPTWPAQTKSAIVSSGTHQLQFHYENIDMADASNNKLVCEYAYRVVALEDGGRKEEECGCGGSTCSPEGGLPEARSLVPGVASSSAGSEFSASITEDSLFWSCNVGVLRGMGAALGGKVVLQAIPPSPNGSMVRKARRRGCSASPQPRAIMPPVRR